MRKTGFLKIVYIGFSGLIFVVPELFKRGDEEAKALQEGLSPAYAYEPSRSQSHSRSK